MEKEIWRDIPGYEDKYIVSNLGKVFVVRSGREKKILNPSLLKCGYHRVWLFGEEKKSILVHRIVAAAFLGLDLNNRKLLVCHKDDNRINNVLDNLFLGTHKDNMQDMMRKGRNTTSKPVLQYSKEGKLIKEWESIISALRGTGVSRGSISKSCSGHFAHGGGFVWRYK